MRPLCVPAQSISSLKDGLFLGLRLVQNELYKPVFIGKYAPGFTSFMVCKVCTCIEMVLTESVYLA